MEKINEKRRRVINDLETNLRQLLFGKKTCEETISRLEKLETRNVDQVKNKISSLRQSILQYDEDIKTQNEKINSVKTGEESSLGYIQNKGQEKETKIIKEQRERVEQEEKNEKEKKKFQHPFVKEPRQKDFDRENGYFLKKCDSLPSYMKSKLDNMPSNKGFIFRGVWFFGKKRPESTTTDFMFERKGKDVMMIYEITEAETKVYEKNGNKQVLKSVTPRKFIKMRR